MSAGRAGFTTRASCLIAAGVTAVLCGFLLGVQDLVRAGALAAALPLGAALVVHRSQVRIANRRALDPARAVAGESVGVNLTISNRAMLPTGTLLLEDQLPHQVPGHARFVLDRLGGREARTVSYQLPALGRGRYRAGPLRVRITDPFHLIDVTRSFTSTSEFIVTPVVDALSAGEPPRSYDIGESASSHSVGTHGADDASTREYRTGDDLRKIHWRSSARTGVLMVRQEERPWQGQSTVVLDLRSVAHAALPDLGPTGFGGSRVTGPPTTSGDPAAPADPRVSSSLEWAVSAAASIGTHLVVAGRELGLLSDLAHPDRIWHNDTTRLAEYLGCVQPATAYADLSPFADNLRAAGRDSVTIAVLGTLDPVSLRLLAQAHPRGSSIPAFALLLDVATWRQPDAVASTDCAASALALRSAGWRVVVASSGDTTAGAWRALMRSAAREYRASEVMSR